MEMELSSPMPRSAPFLSWGKARTRLGDDSTALSRSIISFDSLMSRRDMATSSMMAKARSPSSPSRAHWITRDGRASACSNSSSCSLLSVSKYTPGSSVEPRNVFSRSCMAS